MLSADQASNRTEDNVMAGRGAPRIAGKVVGPPCPVCGKPRSTGIRFIDHGKCAEKLAAEANKKKPRGNFKDVMSDDEVRLRRFHRNTKELRTKDNLKFFTRGD